MLSGVGAKVPLVGDVVSPKSVGVEVGTSVFLVGFSVVVVGEVEGFCDSLVDGLSVGDQDSVGRVGPIVGLSVINVGEPVGPYEETEGDLLGDTELGDSCGALVGLTEVRVGLSDGAAESASPVGSPVGDHVVRVGTVVGFLLGVSVGAGVGSLEGLLGLVVGDHDSVGREGPSVGSLVAIVGVHVGLSVWSVGELEGGGVRGGKVGALVGLVVVLVGLCVFDGLSVSESLSVLGEVVGSRVSGVGAAVGFLLGESVGAFDGL